MNLQPLDSVPFLTQQANSSKPQSPAMILVDEREALIERNRLLETRIKILEDSNDSFAKEAKMYRDLKDRFEKHIKKLEAQMKKLEDQKDQKGRFFSQVKKLEDQINTVEDLKVSFEEQVKPYQDLSDRFEEKLKEQLNRNASREEEVKELRDRAKRDAEQIKKLEWMVKNLVDSIDANKEYMEFSQGEAT